MKECCGNPDVNYYTYNPGEVRLYGRIPDYFLPNDIPISRERFDELMKTSVRSLPPERNLNSMLG